ncbi:MAG: enoyl-CoA hydratase/isomerase family protein [Halobacteria archaeon]
MEHLNIDNHEGVAVVAFDRPPANALGRELVSELRKALGELEAKDGVNALVLSSDFEDFFCAGLDLYELPTYNETELEEFVRDVLGLTLQMLRYDLPLVAAVPGHCTAAGAHLAAYADFRIASKGDYQIAYHEVDVGIPVVEPEILPVKDLVGTDIRDLFLKGEVWGPDRAYEAGLYDELVAPEEVEEEAVSLARDLGGKPSKNYSFISTELRGTAVRLFDENMETYVEDIMEVASDPDTQRAVMERVSEIE